MTPGRDEAGAATVAAVRRRRATARCCRATAWRAGCAPRCEAPAQITVRIVGADEGRALNRDYRGKDYATNVLTFDYEHAPVVVADLVLCAPVVEREAQAQGIRCRPTTPTCWCMARCTRRATTTSDDAEARAMEARESALLPALGLADPYRPAADAPALTGRAYLVPNSRSPASPRPGTM